MFRLANLIRHATATTGTGTITLGAAVSGFLTFALAGVATGDVVTYAIEDGSNREIGRGTYTSSGTTLSRDVILDSTNGGAAISLSGSAQVFVTASDEDLLHRDNRIVNGDFRRYTRAAASSADRVGVADGWYVLTQTAAITPSQLTDPEVGTVNAIRLSQAQAAAQRMGVCQLIRSEDMRDLRSAGVCLGARIRCSASQAIRYAILEWTGTADAPTREIVNTWTNATFTAGQFFLSTTLNVIAVGTVTPAANTWTSIGNLTASLGASGTNLYVFFWTDGTAAQNVTLDVSNVWFGEGTVPPRFKPKPDDLDACLSRIRKGTVTMRVANSGVIGTDLSQSLTLSPPMPQIANAGITLTSGPTYLQGSGFSLTVPDIWTLYASFLGTVTNGAAQVTCTYLADGELGTP